MEKPDTLSVPVTDSCEVRGYDCESPADDLLHKICHLDYPACDPVLAVCCGHNSCKACLELYRQSKSVISG